MNFERFTLTALAFALLAAPALGQEVDISKGKIKVQGANGERVEIGTDDDGDEPAEEGAAAITAITGNGKKVALACAPGKASFTVAGNKNELTLTGDCEHITVSGNGNVVRVERVASISLTGNKNVATYVDGVGGQAPKLSKTGNGNSIKKVAPPR